MVFCKDIWLGLGPTYALARLDRDDRFHRSLGRWRAAHENRNSAFCGLQCGSRSGAVGDMLLERRSSAVALGKRRMENVPNQAPEPTPLAITPAANAPVAPPPPVADL